jgi:hypothetical protein
MLFAIFSRYEELCNVCYGFKLTPSAAEVITSSYYNLLYKLAVL